LKYKKLRAVKVVIKNLRMQEIPVEDSENTLIFHFGRAGQDWMQACGSKGRCTTCLLDVLEGEEHLSPLADAEIRYLAAGRMQKGQRLACQTKTRGNLLVSVPPGGRLPHLNYTEEKKMALWSGTAFAITRQGIICRP
jgi:2Fe-2S ferredoxin